MSFTINDLKKQLGPGLGIRNNKYLLEIPIPGIEGEKLNILCKSAGLPERNISTTTMFHKGRKYNVRAETDYVGTYEVTILEDSNMNIRKIFDKWLKKVDNSKPPNNGIFSGASYEEGIGEALDIVKSGVGAANQIKNAIEDPNDAIGGFFLGMLDAGQATSIAKYQTDINIWQLTDSLGRTSDGKYIASSYSKETAGDKVYGYKLQNAFPSSIGIMTLSDDQQNALAEFNITFTFSEFIPLENKGLDEQLIRAVAGDDVGEIFDGVESLFD